METLIEKINNLLIQLNFKEVVINDTIFYEQANYYYRITYIKGLDAFVIEYTDSIERAEKKLLEDGDRYPISLGEDVLLEKLKEDLLEYYIK